MARLIGDAYIVIYPQTDQFLPLLEEQLKKATAAAKPTVNVRPTMDKAAAAAVDAEIKDATRGADAVINPVLAPGTAERLRSEIKTGLGDQSIAAYLDPGVLAKIDTQIKGEFEAARASIEPLLHTDFTAGVKIDPASLAAARAGLDAYLEHNIVTAPVGARIETSALDSMKKSINAYMSGMRAVDIGVQVDPDQLAKMKASLDSYLKTETAPIPVRVNDTQAMTDLQMMAAEAGKVRLQLDSLRAKMTDSDAIAKIAALQAQAAKLSKSLVLAPDDADLEPFDAALTKIVAGYDNAIEASKAMDQEIKNQGTLWGSLGLKGPGSLIHITDILNASIPEMKLFDGAIGAMYKSMTGNALPSFAKHLVDVATSAHLTVEAAVEFTAIWGPALIGLAAFSAAAVPTLVDIGVQLKNMKTVTEATNQQFKNLASSQSAVANAVKPEVMQLFGEYLVAAGNGGTHLATVLKAVGDVLDDFGAKIVQALQNPGTSKFLDKAASDIKGLGIAFTQVGRIVEDFLQDVPGYAEILLKLGDAALTAGADIIGAINPAIAVFLKVHGAILYLGIAATALIKLGKGATEAGLAIKALGDVEATGGKLQALGIAIGTMAGKLIDGGKAAVTFAKAMLGMDTMAGVSAEVTKLGTAMDGLKDAEGSAAGITALDSAIEGLKGATTSAAAMTALDDALEGLKDAEGAELAVTALSEAVEGLKAASEAAGAVGLLSKAMDAVPFGPWGLLAAGAAAVIGVGFYAALHQAASAADQLGTAMKKMIDNSNIVTVQQNIAAATKATSAQITQQAKAVNNLVAANKSTGDAVVNLHTGEYTTFGKALTTTTSQIKTNQGALTGYANESATVALRMNALGKSYGDAQTQAQLFTLAGVKQSDIVNANAQAWAFDMVKVKATAEAYGIMGSQSGQAGRQLDTLTISSGNVTKAMQSLTGAESQWLSMITGGDSAFTSFEEGMATLKDSMAGGSAAGVKLTTTSGKLTEQQALLKTAFTGTSTSALAARQSFDSQIQSAGTLYGNLQTLAAASGNGAKAQGQLASAGKDLVAQLLPLAKGSKEATSEVYALAQMVGYNGPQSFSAMTQWLGKTTNAEKDLDKQQANLTESSANLSAAAKNLAGALTSDVTASQGKALLSTTQFQAAQNSLIGTLQQTKGGMTSAASEAAGNYYSSLTKAGLSTDQARAYVDALLQKLGVTPASIQAVNAQLANMTAAETTAGGQTQTLTNLQNALKGAIDKNKSSASATAITIAGQYYNALIQAGNGASTAKADVDAFLTKLGATQGVVNQVNAALASLPKQVDITINEKLVQTTTAITTTSNSALPKAVGGLIPGFARGGGFTVRGMAGGGASGRDSVHAMLAPGELVIPASHAPKFRDSARKASIPGFAGGGFMPEPTFGTDGYSAPMTATIPAPTGYASASSMGNTGMPPATTYQMAQLISLTQMLIKQNSQQPYAMAQAMSSTVGTGVRRGYYATGG